MKNTGLQILFRFLFLRALPYLVGLLCFSSVFADSGLGGMARNMMGSVGFASDFIYTGCLVIGGSFVFASIIKYMEHRRSPLMVPISTVIFLAIAGIILLLMPLLSLIYPEAVPYTFLH